MGAKSTSPIRAGASSYEDYSTAWGERMSLTDLDGEPRPRRGRSLVARVFQQIIVLHPKERARRLAERMRPRIHRANLLTNVLSGTMCGILMFTYCTIFASIVFSPKNESLFQYVAVLVNMNVLTAVVSGLATSAFSSCNAFIAGPDANPAIIHMAMVQQINDFIVTDGDSTGSVVPTIVAAIGISSFTVGIAFYLLGALRLVRVVQFLPAVVLHGFMACVGWNTFKIAVYRATDVELTWGNLDDIFLHWSALRLLLPALGLGITLFILRRAELVDPSKVFPFLLFFPLLLFYLILLALGMGLEEARATNWMFKEIQPVSLYRQWEILSWESVSITAILTCIAEYFVLIFITGIDHLLKLAGSEKKMQVEVDFDYEFKMAGLNNCVTAACMGPPGYPQITFNTLNYGIVRTTAEKLPGYLCASICGIIFVMSSQFPLINYLPRFFLSGLLLYGCLGAIVDNLLESWRFISRTEFVAVWLIVIVFGLFGLLPAIGLGLVLSAFNFARQYAQHTPIKVALTGADYRAVVRGLDEERKLEHLGLSKLLIFRLQGYLFFGSATQVHTKLQDVCAAQIPPRYLLIDFEEVSGIDAASTGVLLKFGRLAKRIGVVLLWTGLSDRIHRKLERMGAVEEESVFLDLDLAVEWVENQLLDWSHTVRQRWLVDANLRYLHAVWQLHTASVLQSLFLHGGSPERFLAYCTRQTYRPSDTVCDVGDTHHHLYYLLDGRIDVWVETEDHRRYAEQRRTFTVLPGAFLNEDSFWLGVPCQFTALATHSSTVLCLTPREMSRMEQRDPQTAHQVHRCALRHLVVSRTKMRRQLNAPLHPKGTGHTHHLDNIFGPAEASSRLACAMGTISRTVPDESPICSSLQSDASAGQVPRDSFVLPELSPTEVRRYRDLFGLHARGDSLAPPDRLHRIIVNLLRRERDLEDGTTPTTLTHELSTGVAGGPVDLETFLQGVRRSVLAPLPRSLVRKLEVVFRSASDAPSAAALDVGALARLASEVVAEPIGPSTPVSSRGMMGAAAPDRRGVPEEEIQRLAAEVVSALREARGPHSPGEVNLNFLVSRFARLIQRNHLRERMERGFAHFAELPLDVDLPPTPETLASHGRITLNSLSIGMTRSQVDITTEELQDMLQDANQQDSRDGLTFDEFAGAIAFPAPREPLEGTGPSTPTRRAASRWPTSMSSGGAPSRSFSFFFRGHRLSGSTPPPRGRGGSLRMDSTGSLND